MNNKIKNIVKDLSESKTLKVATYIFGILFIFFLIFQAGVSVGFHKAKFARDWGQNYYQNFGPRGGGRNPMPKMMMGMGDRFPNANGANGKIIKLDLPTLIVQDLDNTEKVILINDETKIVSQKEEISVDNLKVDNFIVVIGNPNDQGQIEAKLIRLMPLPPDQFNKTINKK